MFKANLKIFLLFVLIVLLFVLFKSGQIFDLGVVFRSWLTPQSTSNGLLAKPTDLEEQYKNLLAENSQLQALVEENEQLKQLLGFKKEKNRELVIARILSRDPVNRNLLTITAGEEKGIKIGQAVVVNNGLMVGKIIAVNKDSAQVRLLTDGFSKLAVQTEKLAKIAGLMTGSLGLGMNLDYIPQDDDLKKGDLIATSDLEPLIPAGLIVGRVETVDYSQEELFKTASLSPLIDYNTLSLVAVITSL
jgi:rod shape-determining protein MreC